MKLKPGNSKWSQPKSKLFPRFRLSIIMQLSPKVPSSYWRRPEEFCAFVYQISQLSDT